VHTGEPKDEKVPITLFRYNEAQCVEEAIGDFAEYRESAKRGEAGWLNVDGVHDVDLLSRIQSIFDLHPLVVEDIANTAQRPKMDDYGDYMYLSMRMLTMDGDTLEIQGEQVSIVLTRDLLISFQEKPGDVFESIRERLRQGKGRIRKQASDYLMYSLLDAVVDQHFIILESLETEIDRLEQSVVEDPGAVTLNDIHRVKKEVLFLKRSAWPLREIISRLERVESPLVSRGIIPFLRDVYDHIIQIIEIAESFQDILSSLLDLHLSSASDRMNRIMKVLTLVATIFIPLTFIAGIYGMNFRHMPELEWRWAYPALIGIMIAAGVSMVFYFKRKKWF